MDFSTFMLIALVAAAAIAALVKSAGMADRVRRIEERFAALERRVAAGGVVGTAGAAPQAATPPAPEIRAAEAARQIEDIPERFRDAPATAGADGVEPQGGDAATAPSGVPPIPPSPLPAGPSLEERFGTRWVVWVGGLALALGGIFLVYYTIEQDLIGPGVRVLLGALLALALIAAGEWQRRQERTAGVAGLPSANIPAILTAAGTTVAFATVYVAYAIYPFLSAAVAFVFLGVVALATLAAALLHGPWLAGLGLVGAFATPLLVSTTEPSYWALYLYLAVVTGAAYTLARMRLWRWLALAAVGFGFFWLLPALPDRHFEVVSAAAFHVVVGYALIAAMIVCGLFYGPPSEPDAIDVVSSISVGTFLLGATLLVLFDHHGALTLIVFSALTVATLAIAWRTDATAATVPLAAVLAIVVIGEWALAYDWLSTIAPAGTAGVASPQPSRTDATLHLMIGGGYAALFAVAGFLAQGRSATAQIPILWSASAVLAPIAIMIALYYRIAGFERSIPFAFIALALTAAFAWATEQLDKRPPRPGIATAGALAATGAVAALALAFTFALEKGWLTIGLALMVPGIAWVLEKRPLPMLRWLAAAIAVLVVLRIGWEPRIVGRDVGTTPIFNWLLYGYGIPAVSFWYAGHLMRRRADDRPSRTVDAAAILFSVLLVVLEIRHYMNSGDVYRSSGDLPEVAMQVCAFLAMTIGLEHVRGRTKSVVHNIGALLLAGVTLLIIVFGLGLFANPMFTGTPVGGLFINLILLGYGLPAILAITLALSTRQRRSHGYRQCAAICAVALALSYLSLEVRAIYHGQVLTSGATSNAEQYTYSVVWLAFGVVLLVAGILLRSQPARLASAAIVTLTVGKVFLWDMSDLGGVYRALSFIGLGLVLVGIGWLYQRLLFPQRAQPAAAPSAAPPTT